MEINKINIKDAIKMVKNEAMTNVILLSHMPNLSIEDKMYLCYFIGMNKGKPYELVFNEVVEFEIDIDKINMNKEQ